MPDNEIQAVSLKLPSFWPQQPEVWFAQTEAQFAIRNITTDDTKYYYVVGALDQDTAGRVLHLLRNPPANDKYKSLKDKLLETFTLSDNQRAKKLLHMPELGDDSPSSLMDKMLALLGEHEPCFLFRQLFLERMPEHIVATLVHSKVEDARELAKAADKLWEAARPTASAVRHNKLGRGTATDSKKPGTMKTGLCYYHTRFGAGARNCNKPCSFSVTPAASDVVSPSGNALADRQ